MRPLLDSIIVQEIARSIATEEGERLPVRIRPARTLLFASLRADRGHGILGGS